MEAGLTDKVYFRTTATCEHQSLETSTGRQGQSRSRNGAGRETGPFAPSRPWRSHPLSGGTVTHTDCLLAWVDPGADVLPLLVICGVDSSDTISFKFLSANRLDQISEIRSDRFPACKKLHTYRGASSSILRLASDSAICTELPMPGLMMPLSCKPYGWDLRVYPKSQMRLGWPQCTAAKGLKSLEFVLKSLERSHMAVHGHPLQGLPSWVRASLIPFSASCLLSVLCTFLTLLDSQA